MSRSIRLSIPYLGNPQLREELLSDILDSGFLVQGKYVAQFEASLSHFLKVPHAIATSSGTASLHLVLAASGIGAGDEILVPAYTFPATVNVIELLGATPVLVDIDPADYNMDLAALERAISPGSKAILPVHLFGNPVAMDQVNAIASRHDLLVFEDAAGALGSTWQQQLCGTFAQAGCFSFHPRKTVTTGEGGLIATRDEAFASKLRQMRNHGLHRADDGTIHFPHVGFNYRMNEIGAALGLCQMREIDTIVSARQQLAAYYIKQLSRIPRVAVQQVQADASQTWQAFVIRVQGINNQTIIGLLREQGIETTIGTYAIHLLEYYQNKYGYVADDFPVSRDIYASTLALPFYYGMAKDQVDAVVQALARAVHEI